MMGRWFFWGMPYYGGGLGVGGMLFGLLAGLLVLLALAAILYWLLRRAPRSSVASTPAVLALSPQEVASLRYARGELTREQYQQLLADLNQQA